MIQNNKIVVNTVQISCDYQTGQRCGAGGFQVTSANLVTEYGDLDITDFVDQGKHYYSLNEVTKDLGFDNIDVEEI